MDDNANLEARVAALEQWKSDRETQQISFPLDFQSQQILGEYLMRISSLINYEVVGAASHTVFLFLGNQGKQNFQISTQTLFPYTVNTSTSTITTSTNFTNGTRVHFNSTATGSFPNPLTINTSYFIVNSAGSTFQVSATSGGSPITLTSVGTGSQYIEADSF